MFGAKTISDKASRAPLASHPAFAWLLIGWSAALFGLSTLVVTHAFSQSSLLPFIAALVAAAIGGFCGYQIAKSAGAKMPKLAALSALTLPAFAMPAFKMPQFKRKSSGEEVGADGTAHASILSTKELGSASLDAPLEDSALVEEPAVELTEDMEESPMEWAPSVSDEETDVAAEMTAEVEWEEPVADSEESLQDDPTFFEDAFAYDGLDGPASPNDRHRGEALGRAAYGSAPLSFGALEDRADDANIAEDGAESAALDSDDEPLALDAFELADEVEAPVSDVVEQEAEPAAAMAAEHAHDGDVVSLKERELAELSLVQMVERFAVRLEGHRQARVNDPAGRPVRRRNPQVAQAIRALPISELQNRDDAETRAEAEQTEEALREALEKLQRMSDHS